MDVYREKNYYSGLEPFGEGKNSKLYLNNNYLDKVLFNYSDYTLVLNRGLLERKENLKLTNPIEGSLFVNDICVGSVIPLYRRCAVFSRVIRSYDYDLKYEKLNQIMDAYKELQDNFIYPRDIHEQNILISSNNRDIHLIDLTDHHTSVYDQEKPYYKGLMDVRIKNLMIKTLCFPIIKTTNYNIDTLEQINFNNNNIEVLKKAKSIEDLKDFNELTHKDNAFLKLLKLK